MDILNYIPVGHKNAVTRGTLSNLTGMKDRTNRELIEQVRQHYVVLNMGDAKGYFLPGPGEENLVRACRNKELSRYRAIGRTIRAMDKYLNRNKKDTPGQISMFDWKEKSNEQ